MPGVCDAKRVGGWGDNGVFFEKFADGSGARRKDKSRRDEGFSPKPRQAWRSLGARSEAEGFRPLGVQSTPRTTKNKSPYVPENLNLFPDFLRIFTKKFTMTVATTKQFTYITEIISKQKQFFKQGKTFPLNFRKKQLKKLKEVIRKNEEAIYRALQKDLGKSLFESYVSEVGFTYEELNDTLKHLSRWTKKKKGLMSFAHFFATYEIERVPRGNTLIIAPWNYPFQLLMAPLIGALAGGNTAILKPSEFAPATSEVLYKIISENFPEEYIAVVQGDVETNKFLLRQSFDFIFFTGSPQVGKIVMKQASEHLTPVVLELGGKSPAIVSQSANLPVSARRIVWGKFLNAGQTCIAPDYLLVHESIREEFLALLVKNIETFYGKNPETSDSYGRIVSEKHFKRLESYLNEAQILYGGKRNLETLYFQPTLVRVNSYEHPLMQEEIFGPILPVISWKNVAEVLEIIELNPYPLALYYFGNNKREEEKILQNIRFGGGAINDTLIHIASTKMPFGGVRSSGIGNYHGKYSFEAFTHPRSLARKSIFPDIPLRYPPYTSEKLKWVKKFLG